MDAGLERRIFLNYAELFEAKYAGKYAKFGEICSACICRIYAAHFPAYFQHMRLQVMENHNYDH